MELLVTMVISSIVISIAFVAYEIIYKQYYSYKNTNDKIRECLTLKTTLNNDFILSEKIIKSAKGLSMIDRMGKILSYNLSKDYIIRELDEVRDTFFLPIENLQIKFQKHDQVENEYIDEFSFEALLFNEKEEFHFFKQYGCDRIMESENK